MIFLPIDPAPPPAPPPPPRCRAWVRRAAMRKKKDMTDDTFRDAPPFQRRRAWYRRAKCLLQFIMIYWCLFIDRILWRREKRARRVSMVDEPPMLFNPPMSNASRTRRNADARALSWWCPDVMIFRDEFDSLTASAPHPQPALSIWGHFSLNGDIFRHWTYRIFSTAQDVLHPVPPFRYIVYIMILSVSIRRRFLRCRWYYWCLALIRRWYHNIAERCWWLFATALRSSQPVRDIEMLILPARLSSENGYIITLFAPFFCRL